MDREPNPYLYLLIRKDLPSLNPGKAVAHGAHAANQFTFEANAAMAERVSGWQVQYDRWINSTPSGFGTTITLHVNYHELRAAVKVAKALGFRAGETYDPSYPYETTHEIARLIQHPEEFPPVPRGNGTVVCFRRELTAGYVFGDKDELRPVLGNFPLMP